MTDQILIVGQRKDKEQLTRPQKEFNRLTKRIAKLRADIQQIEAVSGRMHQRYITVLLPLQQKFSERQSEIVRLFDKAHRSGLYKSQERKKLEDLILTIAFELITEGLEEMKEIYDRYSEASYDEALAEAEEEAAENMKKMMQEMFGLETDEDLRTPEQMQAFFTKHLEEQEALAEDRRKQQEERRANRQKTEKQLEKEQKQAEEERNISKSVREVYLELAKSFHPDLEPDEQEKQRKTEVMQRIAQAYEDNDLLTLLQLQLEFEQIDQEHLENIAEDRLKHFTKILQRQAAELREALYAAEAELERITGQPVAGWPPLYVESEFEKEIKRWKKNLRDLEKDLQMFAEQGYLKSWLKTYDPEA